MINNCSSNSNSSDTYTKDYIWTAGDSEEIVIRLKDELDQVIPITSGSVQLRATQTSSTVVLDVDGSYDEDTGIFTVEFSSTETQSIIADNQKQAQYFYDLQLLLANGKTYTPIKGKIKVLQSITR